jgi:hypothetical protein
MALAEFSTIETAYRALAQLDPAARTRALSWLTDALSVPGVLPERGLGSTVAAAPTPTTGVDESPASVTAGAGRRAGRRAASDSVGATRAAGESEQAQRPRVRAAKSVAARETSTVRGGRAYRRMPPAAEVMSAYGQVGTVSGLAEYFGVPRHTVSGWARRLRSEGYEIGRAA